MRKTMYTGCFSNTRHTLPLSVSRGTREINVGAHRDDDVRAIAVLCYHLQSLDRFCIAHNIVKDLRPVFLYPVEAVIGNIFDTMDNTAYQGSS